LRARHRPGPIANPTALAGTAVPAHRYAHDAHRSTGEHPPAAANTVRAATEQHSLLLTHKERSYLISQAAQELCPNLIWQLRNSAADYRPVG
jgi:hypothetical protein